ncbi:hypothetical protein ACFVXC_09390 [Streptomyces sp. NPDC058257]|uniref:hypothetical protein n=1 Tax=Streptomyces sp. NPDC058257 TaxID=3346409 RepID=UPI0036E53799
MAGPAEGHGRALLLPDLAHVDLRTLRAMDDPRLAEAVERVLAHSRELGDSWFSGDGPTYVDEAHTGRMVPAGSGASRHREERAG